MQQVKKSAMASPKQDKMIVQTLQVHIHVQRNQQLIMTLVSGSWYQLVPAQIWVAFLKQKLKRHFNPKLGEEINVKLRSYGGKDD